MEFKDIIGKTIIEAKQMRSSTTDDEGYLLLVFSDNTSCIIEGGVDETWTGDSIGEYPTTISIQDNIKDLEELT
jgi:hypothetical protein